MAISVLGERRNIRFEREERKRRRRREEKEKKVTRAGIEPTAAAPGQPTRLDVSRSDHSAGSLSFSLLSLLSPSDQPSSTVSVRTVALKLASRFF